MSLIRFLMVTAAVAAFTIPTPQGAFAQDEDAAEAKDAAEVKKFGDWAFLCPEEGPAAALGCRIIQSAILNVEGEEGAEPQTHRVMLTTIGYVADEEAPVITSIVPLGILLPPGVRLKVEGYDELRIPLQRCDGNGCVALLPMKARLVEAFKNGAEGHVTFFNVAGKPNKVRLSLEGFKEGLAALNAARAGK